MTDELVVLARNPQEMAVAQTQLVGWADKRLASLRADLAEAEENFAIARRRKWKLSAWERRVRVEKKRIEYYEKVKAAIAAGYCIMPDMPISLIAIRTTRAMPKHEITKARWAGTPALVHAQDTNYPALGTGDYVDPTPFAEYDEVRQAPSDPNNENMLSKATTAEWDRELDFPMRFVKPQVLEDLEAALKLKIFDEIGILPSHKKQPDPIVVGRIVRKEGYQRISISFLITWWIDTSTL